MMKNVLFFALLTLSTISFSQDGVPSSIRPISPDEYLLRPQSVIKDTTTKIQGKDVEYHFNSSPDEVQSLILPPVQLFDSIIYWKLDTSINEWVYKHKELGFVYDAHLNLLSLTIQKWDGIHWIDSMQIDWSYDDRDSLIYTVVKRWTDTVWVNAYNNTYTYDPNHNHKQTRLLVQSWDGSGWLNSWQEIRSYDVYDNLDVKTRQLWNVPSWEDDRQYLYEYDGRRNQLSEVQRSWYAVADVWVYGKKQVYTYDTLDNLTSHTTQKYDGLYWNNEDLVLNTYDTMNNLISVVTQRWNDSTSIWTNVSLRLYEYNSFNNLVSLKVQSWMNDTWSDTGWVTYEYDGDKNPTEVLYRIMSNGTWTNFRQQLLAYGANHTVISHLIWLWNGNGWVISFQLLNTYDEDYFLTGTGIRRYIPDGTVEKSGDSTHYYFQVIMTDVNEITPEAVDISVYPNPGKGNFTISSNEPISTVEVYAISGQQIHATAIINKQVAATIDLSNHAKGIYFIRMQSGSKVFTRMIVVQ